MQGALGSCVLTRTWFYSSFSLPSFPFFLSHVNFQFYGKAISREWVFPNHSQIWLPEGLPSIDLRWTPSLATWEGGEKKALWLCSYFHLVDSQCFELKRLRRWYILSFLGAGTQLDANWKGVNGNVCAQTENRKKHSGMFYPDWFGGGLLLGVFGK